MYKFYSYLVVTLVLPIVITIIPKTALAQGCGFNGSELIANAYPETPSSTTPWYATIVIYKASTGEMIKEGSVSSRANECWRWDWTGDSGSDFVCTLGQGDCDDFGFIVAFGGKRWLIVPFALNGPATFYQPYPGGGSPDIGLAYFNDADTAYARKGAPSSSESGYFEYYLGNNYTWPYDRQLYCDALYLDQDQNCTTGSLDGYMPLFLGTILEEDPPPDPFSKNIAPLVPTFSFSGATDEYPNSPIETTFGSLWPNQVWDTPNLTLQFPDNVRLIVNKQLNADGVVFEEAIEDEGWLGIEIAETDGAFVVDGDVSIEHSEYIDVAGVFEVANGGELISTDNAFRFGTQGMFIANGLFETGQHTFSEIATGQGWAGIEVGSSGTFSVTDDFTLEDFNYVDVEGAFEVTSTGDLTAVGGTYRFASGAEATIAGTLDADDVTFTELTADQGWGGLDIASTGTLTISGNVSILDPDYVDVAGTIEINPTGYLTARSGTYRFSNGTELNALGVFDAEDILFTERTTGQGWDGIRVAGTSGRLALDGIIVEHADVGITVASNQNNVIYNALLTDNGVGLFADAVSCGICQITRSYFLLRESCVENSDFDPISGTEGYGVWGHLTNGRIVDTTIRDNDGYGVNFDYADLWVAHGMLARGNGAGSPTAQDGIQSGPYGDVTLASALGGSGFDVGPDRNSIHDNAGDEVGIVPSGYATVGAACISTFQGTQCPIGNRVSEDGYPDNNLLLRNEPADTQTYIPAYNVYWIEPGPPSGAFYNINYVNYSPPITTGDPASDAGRPLGCAASTFIGGGGGSEEFGSSIFERGTASSQRELDSETIAYLRGRIVAMRTFLAQSPGADSSAAVLGRLYGLQRLDHTDILGEYPGTRGLLTSLRARLRTGGSLTPALRATAEAALTASIHDHLRFSEYDEAQALLTTFAPHVELALTRRSLDFAAISLDEVTEDYASALARIDALISELGPEDAQLAADLRATARLISRKMNGEGYRQVELPAQVASTTETAHAASATSETGLGATYPNPFNPQTVIPYALDATADVHLAVYDMLGREIARLVDGRVTTGLHQVTFDASLLPTGLYLVRMTVRPANGQAAQTYTQRITLLR